MLYGLPSRNRVSDDAMNIIVLTADESLYLPTFFAQLFEERARNIRAVFYTPPGHGKKSTTFNLTRKYRAAFGSLNTIRLVLRILAMKVGSRFGIGRIQGKYGSVPDVARAYGIRCEAVSKVNDKVFLQELRDMKTDLILSVSCPQIFRKKLIDLPPMGCLNIHGAPLPKYRGLLPSFWMMANGETRAAVTVFFVNEEIDAGDVVEMAEFDILPNESLHEFLLRSKRIHCETVLRAISKVEAGNVETRPLDIEGGSYFSFPTRDAYLQFRRRGRRLW